MHLIRIGFSDTVLTFQDKKLQWADRTDAEHWTPDSRTVYEYYRWCHDAKTNFRAQSNQHISLGKMSHYIIKYEWNLLCHLFKQTIMFSREDEFYQHVGRVSIVTGWISNLFGHYYIIFYDRHKVSLSSFAKSYQVLSAGNTIYVATSKCNTKPWHSSSFIYMFCRWSSE